MKRLRDSIIKKSELVSKSDLSVSNSKEIRIKRIYKFALENRGGDLETDLAVSQEVFNFASEIKHIVERLACYLKDRELQGRARIFFKNGRLLLELILFNCKIGINYYPMITDPSQFFVVTNVLIGGAAGFTIAWFSAGASLVMPPILLSALFARSIKQQIITDRDYRKFRDLIKKLLEDEKIKGTIEAIFVDGDEKIPRIPGIRMQPWPKLIESPLHNPLRFQIQFLTKQ